MCERAILPLPAPVSRRTCIQTFPGRHDQVRGARSLLAKFLDGCPCTDDAVLLISELAANACTHTASGLPGGTFTIRAETSHNTCVHAEVEDEGSGWDGNISTARSPHGLYLLGELSTDCGAQRGQHGWITWFTIASPAEPGRAPQR